MEEDWTQFKNGALLDTRSEKEKLKDFRFEELVSTINLVTWTEKPPSSYRKFPIFNQDSSGSCVAQTMAKIMGIMYWLKNQNYVHFSATHLYSRRSNKPVGGMIGVDAFKIAQRGVTLEQLVESQNMTDEQMDAVKIDKYKDDVGAVFRIGNYIIGPIKDIETVASIIQTTGKAVMVWYYFKHDEWTDVPEVKGLLFEQDPIISRHSVTAVDFTLYNGKKCLIIEDSWGPSFGKGGQRIITEEFHNARNFFTAHPMNFNFEIPVIPPVNTFKFTLTMKQGDTNNEVKELQLLLQKLGIFPMNVIATGTFGSITKRSVIAFQKSRGLKADGVVGSATRQILNSI